MTFLKSLALAVALSATLWAINLPVYLGAHPWWSQKVVLIGAPIGLVIGAALWGSTLAQRWRLLIAATALVLAGLSAYFGKAGFVASYAEDALAGRFWFFGWIALAAALAGLTLSVARSRA